jgi:myo-inositol-1(or 4)-monophosphatase
LQAIDARHPDLKDDLALIREAAHEAGRIAMRFFRKTPEVWMKGGTSPVCEADLAIDKFLADTLLAARPHYGWLSEETADAPERLAARRTFVVDPIDGTRGFLEGRETWCVSIAVVEAGVPLAGVLDCPAAAEVYAAVAGAGALKNGQVMGVRPSGARPAVGGPKPMVKAAQEVLGGTIQPVGYIPSLAYRVAMVASGRIDATFVKPDSHDWDLAAADLMLREAGGRIVNRAGKMPVYATTAEPSHGAMVAGSGPLLDALAPILTSQSH